MIKTSAGTHTGDGSIELSWREPVAGPQAASTTTRLSINPHSVKTGGTATLTVMVGSSTGTPGGQVVFRGGPAARVVGTATLVNGVATVEVGAGNRTGTRSFVATYSGTPAFAPSTSGHVRLTVTGRKAGAPAVHAPAALPNTGA